MTLKTAAIAAIIALGAAATAASAAAATITFETAPHGFGFTGPVTEDGFTYAGASGDLFVNGFGHDGQSMEGAADGDGGVLDIGAASQADFTFSGLDFAAYREDGLSEQILVVEGFRNGLSVGVDTYVLANTNVFRPEYANWRSFSAIRLAGVRLDDLRITLSGGQDGDEGAIFYETVDNVRLGAAGAPEPATWAMMLVGFGGLGLAVRGRRRAAATVAG